MPAADLTGLARVGVTIVIPNWNHELLLPRAIDSALRTIALLRDRGVPGEVVVIDESSRDGSPVLLRQLEVLYRKDGLRVIAFADTSSLASSRSQALAIARYRYLAFLDADNELIPENMPVFLQALEQTGAAVIYGNLLVRTVTSRCAMNILSNESFQGKVFNDNYIDAFALVDRLQLLDAGGYDAAFQLAEDHEMWLHLATNGRKLVFVPLVFGYYYVLPSSMGVAAGEKALDTLRRTVRIFNQLKARSHLPLNTEMLRFHPALGYF